MIGVYHTYINKNAFEDVSDILQSTFLSEGKKVKEFEQKLTEGLGIVNPVALNSGTAALHLAVVLAGIKEGDEVIIPAQTFVATGLVVVQQGAKVVFADVNYNTGNIDVGSVKAKITEKTKAIIPVHWGGMPCDMDEINELAKNHGLTVIEDAAHAPGAKYKGQFIGSISDYTCFSFQAIKHITTGDGGALACLSNEKTQEALARRWFGIDRKNAIPSFLGERQYDISKLGFKYHMNDYSATLGLANISDYWERHKKLDRIALYYRKELEGVAGLQLWQCPGDRQSAWWLFGMHVEKRDEFIKAMAERGVTASVIHQRIDRNSIFGGLSEDLVQQERFDRSQVHIPLHAGISEQNASYIVESIKKGW